MESNEKKRRGRPEKDNSAVLAEILKNDATRKKFKEQINNLVFHKKAMINEAECFSEDVGAVAEQTGLGKTFISKLVGAIAKNKEASVKAESEGLAEVLEMVFNIEEASEDVGEENE